MHLVRPALLLLATFATSATAAGLTLHDAVQTALRNSVTARSLQIDGNVQQARLAAAHAEFEPRLSLSGRAARGWDADRAGGQATAAAVAGSSLKLPSGTRLEAGIDWSASHSAAGARQPVLGFIQIVQPLLRGAGAAARMSLDLVRMDTRILDLQHHHALDALFMAVVLAYYEAVHARQQVQLAQQALERIAGSRRVNESLIQAGRLAPIDLLQSDADIAQAELSLSQARNAAEAAESALMLLLGPSTTQQHRNDVALVDPIPAPDPKVPERDEALSQALQQRTDLQLASLLVEAARVGVARAEDDARSRLDLVAGAQSARDVSAPDSGRPSFSVGLEFAIPLDRSALRLQKTQATATLEKALMAQQEMERQISTEVDDALRELQFALRQVSMADEAAGLQRRKLEAEADKFQAGRTSSFQLSAAQDALRRAETANVDARLAALRARLRLHQATGHLRVLREQA